jgi:hypothetical protein
MKADQFAFDELLPEAPAMAQKPAKLRDRGRGILNRSKRQKQREDLIDENS